MTQIHKGKAFDRGTVQLNYFSIKCLAPANFVPSIAQLFNFYPTFVGRYYG